MRRQTRRVRYRDHTLAYQGHQSSVTQTELAGGSLPPASVCMDSAARLYKDIIEKLILATRLLSRDNSGRSIDRDKPAASVPLACRVFPPCSGLDIEKS